MDSTANEMIVALQTTGVSVSPPPWWVRLPETTGHLSKEHGTTELGTPVQQKQVNDGHDEPVDGTIARRS
jgi:hypothetical protein